MSRLLFGLGAQGALIVDLQQALATKGFDPKGADGLFGHDTESAVRAYQADAATRVTGAVSDEDWVGLGGLQPDDYWQRVFVDTGIDLRSA